MLMRKCFRDAITYGAVLWITGVVAVIEPIDNHNGILVIKEAIAYHQVDSFSLVVSYNASQLRDIYVQITRDYMTFKLAQTRITFYKNSLVIRNQIEYLIDKIESKLVYLGSSTIGLGRTFIPRIRRGLINGLGSIIKVITGNLDQENAIKIDYQIQEIKKLAIHKQSQTLGIMTDFIKENNAKLNIINKNQKELNQAIKDLSKQNLGLENEMHVINMYNQIEICLQQVYDRVELLENAITFAHLGQLHPSIVDPSFLVAELMKIQGEASKKYTVDVLSYYRKHTCN
ncbi:hypothetical protein O3G_MSEX006906 [Manduca sexta]|uniref:Uncharacterized protein n=1 Tax=Manduca sexta TaxID=7130 RepID=A0A921Z400_MANSE|nr:hypothetical protein O3G_MSEX006906 [Manduca sexta]